jgi:hypothetical protein
MALKCSNSNMKTEILKMQNYLATNNRFIEPVVGCQSSPSPVQPMLGVPPNLLIPFQFRSQAGRADSLTRSLHFNTRLYLLAHHRVLFLVKIERFLDQMLDVKLS